MKEAKMIATKTKFTKDSVIGDIVKNSPSASKVIEKYFGNGCFTCPGMKVESLSFGAMMHNIDPNKIIEELNSLEE
jgi:hybrid cluster-associated redox disulfide protein